MTSIHRKFVFVCVRMFQKMDVLSRRLSIVDVEIPDPDSFRRKLKSQQHEAV